MIGAIMDALRSDPVAAAEKGLERARAAVETATAERATLAAELAAAEKAFDADGGDAAAELVVKARMRAERAERRERTATLDAGAAERAVHVARLDAEALAAIRAEIEATETEAAETKALEVELRKALGVATRVGARLERVQDARLARARSVAQAGASLGMLEVADASRATERRAERREADPLEAVSYEATHRRAALPARAAADLLRCTEAIGARVGAIVDDQRAAAETIGASPMSEAFPLVILERAGYDLRAASLAPVLRASHVARYTSRWINLLLSGEDSLTYTMPVGGKHPHVTPEDVLEAVLAHPRPEAIAVLERVNAERMEQLRKRGRAAAPAPAVETITIPAPHPLPEAGELDHAEQRERAKDAKRIPRIIPDERSPNP